MSDYIPKSIQEWRELHPREEGKVYRPWQEIMESLMKICDDIIADSERDVNQ